MQGTAVDAAIKREKLCDVLFTDGHLEVINKAYYMPAKPSKWWKTAQAKEAQIKLTAFLERLVPHTIERQVTHQALLKKDFAEKTLGELLELHTLLSDVYKVSSSSKKQALGRDLATAFGRYRLDYLSVSSPAGAGMVPASVTEAIAASPPIPTFVTPVVHTQQQEKSGHADTTLEAV